MKDERDSAKSPLVMCLTNTVAANFTANVLLAIGAKPAMMEDPSEAAELATVADAVLVNVGTLTVAQAEAMRAAVRACNAGSVPRETGSVPWVLDPVACQVVSYRCAFVQELLAQNPTVLRGNVEEINFLLGSVPNLSEEKKFLSGSVPNLIRQMSLSAQRSVPLPSSEAENSQADRATLSAEVLQSAIRNLKSICSLATGDVDIIRCGTEEVARVTGGVPMLQQVTATGCAQGAIVAAFLGWGQTPVDALLSASRLMKRAGERAWERAKAPGRFQIALLDALAELSPVARTGVDLATSPRESDD